jgi:hypothetical protein
LKTWEKHIRSFALRFALRAANSKAINSMLRIPCLPETRTFDAFATLLWNLCAHREFYPHHHCCNELEVDMGFGRGILLWLLGIPIPIILLIALFWHH